MPRRSKRSFLSFLYEHSLTLASLALLAFWIAAYSLSDPHHRWGAFFGNAIADWSGTVVIILGTKFFLEVGSAESRPVRGKLKNNKLLELVREHSLLLFLGGTAILWLLLYSRMDAEGKWGQVVGNIVSEWVQMGGLVFFTKRLIERGSKESR